jgi:hypothetical protein
MRPKAPKCLFIILFIFLATFYIAGCGYKEGALVKDPVSYLWFTGNTSQAIVTIDDTKSFELEKEGLIHYQIPPGKHRVVVRKGSEVVVDRVLIIGNEITQEIRIP